MSRTTAPLTEPTSETIAPGLRCGAISCATAPQAPTGMHRMTRSASSTASALVSTTESVMPSSLTRARVLAERAVVTISPASPCSRAARAIEPPISPKPISAILLNGGAAFMGAPRSRASPRPRGDWPLRFRWSCAVRAAGGNCSTPAAPGRVWSGTCRRRLRSCPSRAENGSG